MASEMQAVLKSEILLQVNERLYLGGLISLELYEQARIKIVDSHSAAVWVTEQTYQCIRD